MGYAVGKFSKAMCARCGTKENYRSLKREWTGLWVCPACWEPKHEQLEPREHIHDPQSLEHPYTDNDNDGTVSQQLEEVITMHHGASS